MNKLFLTMLFAVSTTLASAQFVGLTTLNEGTDSTWNVTDKIGVGYMVSEKLMLAATMDGEDAYELLGRYDVYNGVWATCIYNYEKDSEAEISDVLDIGVGYSYNVWNKFYIEPNQILNKTSPSIPLEIKFQKEIKPRYNYLIKNPSETENLINVFERGSIAMVKREKAAVATFPRPVVNIWWDQTANPRKPMTAPEKTTME